MSEDEFSNVLRANDQHQHFCRRLPDAPSKGESWELT